MVESVNREAPIILFVEDEPNMRNLVEKVFLEKGYRIITAPNGIKAMEILINTTPDLIVSDIMMPEMNGIEFFQAVQERFGENRPVFMFLTAKSDEEDIVSGFSLGAEDYITKPVSIRHLASKIEARIKQIQTQKYNLSKGLRGNLQDQGIADIIQFIELAEHTGKLTIESHHREGQIQFRDGRIYWADFSPLSGAEAVFALMALKQGAFHFENSDDVITTNRIKLDNSALILEGMKRIDEKGRDTVLKPVLEADIAFVSQDTLPPEDVSAIETVTNLTIPGDIQQQSNDTEQISDTQQIRAVKTDTGHRTTAQSLRQLTVPDWVRSIDFNNLGRALSELENGDFHPEWLDWNPPDEPSAFSPENPTCVLMTDRMHLLNIFGVLSGMFLMPPASEYSLPTVSFKAENKISFRIIGVPLETASMIPNSILCLPTIFILPSTNLDELIPEMGKIQAETHSGYRIVVSDDPDEAIRRLTSAFSGKPILAVPGKFTTWLNSLLTLGKCLKLFRQVSDNS